MATDDKSLQWLCALFAAGRIKKNYTALVHGNFNETSGSYSCGTWEFPLSKKAGGRNDPAGKAPRVACTTHYRVLQQSCRYSLLDIELVTGRKHQIRRHAKLSGHPVTGDTRYGSKKSVDYLKNTFSYDRLGLHCRMLEFVPPGQKNSICIVSGNPLDQMMHLLAADRKQ
jgi:23S rRNA-/tRNA-specific pseudouridylate synthase